MTGWYENAQINRTMCNEVSCVKKVPVISVSLLTRVQINYSVREDEKAQWQDECFTANEYNVTEMKGNNELSFV